MVDTLIPEAAQPLRPQQAEELEAIAGVDEVSVNEVRPSDTDLIAALSILGLTLDSV